MSDIEKNEKAALMAQDQLTITHLESPPLRTCTCGRPNRLSAHSSNATTNRASLITFLTLMASQVIMICILTLHQEIGYNTAALKLAQADADKPDAQITHTYKLLAVAPGVIMAIFATRGFLAACGVVSTFEYDYKGHKYGRLPTSWRYVKGSR
jgi:hypothetical protein